MRNIALVLEYDGSLYSGWQSQKNATAVQDVVAGAIGRLEGKAVNLVGASRTDAGVHARGQVASFRTESRIPAEKYAYAINALLPAGISCAASAEVPSGFHARFSAVGKMYSYTVFNRRQPSALYRNTAWHVPLPLAPGVAAMREAARLIVGEHDFRAFMSAGSPVKSTVRNVARIDIEIIGDAGGKMPPLQGCDAGGCMTPLRDAGGGMPPLRKSDSEMGGLFIRFIVSGDGFLYNMVRIIVGTLVYIGQGRISAGDVSMALKTGDRRLAGKTAPPHGLCLESVQYNDCFIC